MTQTRLQEIARKTVEAIEEVAGDQTEALAAVQHTAEMWEKDYTDLCAELGVTVDVESVDFALELALENVRDLRKQADALAGALESACESLEWFTKGHEYKPGTLQCRLCEEKRKALAALAAYRKGQQ